MIPVRSRLVAAGVSFVLGFGIANYGIISVPRPDQWVWVAVAAVLMLTAAGGVLFADSTRRFSLWAVLGLELLAVFLVVPLLWLVTLATRPDGTTATHLWPSDARWTNLKDVLTDHTVRHAAWNTVVIAGPATLLAVLLTSVAAYALVRRQFRGRHWVHRVVLAALFLPPAALAGPMSEQAYAFGLHDTRRALAVCTLALTLPLAWWLFVSVLSRMPWSVWDAARADGATVWQRLRLIGFPVLAPAVTMVTLVVFLVASGDVLLGLTQSTTARSLPLATAVSGLTGAGSTALVAGVGLFWLLPAVVVIIVFQRRTGWLLGRSYR